MSAWHRLPAALRLAQAGQDRLRFFPKRYFPFYLKEMEFRYNHWDQSLFDLLAQFVTKPVSDR